MHRDISLEKATGQEERPRQGISLAIDGSQELISPPQWGSAPGLVITEGREPVVSLRIANDLARAVPTVTQDKEMAGTQSSLPGLSRVEVEDKVSIPLNPPTFFRGRAASTESQTCGKTMG